MERRFPLGKIKYQNIFLQQQKFKAIGPLHLEQDTAECFV